MIGVLIYIHGGIISSRKKGNVASCFSLDPTAEMVRNLLDTQSIATVDLITNPTAGNNSHNLGLDL